MELIFITHSNIFSLHFLPVALSWALVIGAGYGALRLAYDVAKTIGRFVKALSHTRVTFGPAGGPPAPPSAPERVA